MWKIQLNDFCSFEKQFQDFEKRLKTNMAYFKIEVEAPDGICQFSYSEDGKRFKKINL